MNKIKSQLLLKVQDKIEDVKPKEVGIPIGNIINSHMFSGWGPIIPVRLISIGTINTDFKNSFEAAGINQTKHEISVEVTGKINILLPILSVSSEVVTTVPVAHTILVGDVPDQYINIEGTTIGFPINK